MQFKNFYSAPSSLLCGPVNNVSNVKEENTGMDSSQDLFGSDSPRTSSGVASQNRSTDFVSEGGSQLPSQPSQSAESAVCNRCNKQFKTVAGCKRHKLIHILNDSMKNVSKDELLNKSYVLADLKLAEIENDPAIQNEEEFQNFLSLLIQKSVDHHQEWKTFIDFVTKKILAILFYRNHVLPASQYEDNLIKMTNWLSNIEERICLENMLGNVCESDSPHVIRFVSYRFCMKMFNSLKVEFLQMLKGANQCQAISAPAISLSKDEEQSLFYSVGSVVKTFLRKKRYCNRDSLWIQRIACIESRFCYVEDSVYSDEYYELKKWLDSVNRGGLTVVNEETFKFFLGLEIIIRSAQSDEVSSAMVIESLLQPINTNLLDIWYHLTIGILCHSESLNFLDKVIEEFTAFSMRAEASYQMRNMDVVSGVALRTNLKRN